MSQSGVKGERVATVPVAPGIFVLHYHAAKAATPPLLFVRVSPASENSVALIFAPGAETGVLAAPGSYVLVVAERSGRLQLTIVGAPGEDDGAEVKIEPVGKLVEAATRSAGVDAHRARELDSGPIAATQGSAPARRWVRPPASTSAAGLDAPRAAGGDEPQPVRSLPAVAREPANAAGREPIANPVARLPTTLRAELNAVGFGFVCHVARKGDVAAAGGRWIGGPGSPSVIEGVTLHWNGPAGSQLEYQALVSGAGGRWSAWTAAGAFAGTRGHGLPLVGLRVRIAGDSASRFHLHGEAIFLGLPVVAESGERLEFTSHAGVDPLVGLRLDLAPTRSELARGRSRPDSAEPAGTGAANRKTRNCDIAGFQAHACGRTRFLKQG